MGEHEESRPWSTWLKLFLASESASGESMLTVIVTISIDSIDDRSMDLLLARSDPPESQMIGEGSLAAARSMACLQPLYMTRNVTPVTLHHVVWSPSAAKTRSQHNEPNEERIALTSLASVSMAVRIMTAERLT